MFRFSSSSFNVLAHTNENTHTMSYTAPMKFYSCNKKKDNQNLAEMFGYHKILCQNSKLKSCMKNIISNNI